MTGSWGWRRAESQPGKGSTFTITLPMDVQADAPRTPAPSLPGPSTRASEPSTVQVIVGEPDRGFALGAAEYLTKPLDRDRLISVIGHHVGWEPQGPVSIVQEDANLRQMLRRMLEGEGWPVAEAANGAVALERVRERVPSAIVWDLMLPVMDGFALLAELRRQEAWARIPVVVATALELSAKDRGRLQGLAQRVVEKGQHTREDLPTEVRLCIERAAAGAVEAGPAKPNG